MTKTKRTITVIALFAATLLCALFATFAAAPAKTFAEEPVAQEEYVNLCDIVNQFKFTNPNTPKYLQASINEDGDTVTIKCIQGYDIGTNYIYRFFVYLERDVEYKFSFKIKTDKMSESSNWKVVSRFIQNGKPATSGERSTTGSILTDWEEVSYTFIPTETAMNGEYGFDLCFFGLNEDEIIMIKDIKVEYPLSAVKNRGENLWNETFRLGSPDYRDKLDLDDTQTDEKYGKVYKYSLKTTVEETPVTAQNVMLRSDVAFVENVTYHVSYMYKTEKAKEDSFASATNIVRFLGKGAKFVNAKDDLRYSGARGIINGDGQWRMFNYVFTYDNMPDPTENNKAQTETTFDIYLVGMNPGDTVYIADLYISAVCDTCAKDVVYDWAKDYSSCTAKDWCTACHKVYGSETTTNISVTDTATCTEDGEKTYTATFTNTEFKTGTAVIKSVAGHKYGDATYTWSEDNTKCTAVRTCTVEGCNGKEEEPVDAVASEDTATCTEAGKITYTATFTNSVFEKQTKPVDTPAKGHDYKDGKCTRCEAADPEYKAPDAGTDNNGSDNTGSDNTGKTDDEGKSGCGSSISAITFLPALVLALLAAIVIAKNARKKD